MQNIYVETCYEMECNFINVNCEITEYIAADAQICTQYPCLQNKMHSLLFNVTNKSLYTVKIICIYLSLVSVWLSKYLNILFKKGVKFIDYFLFEQ